MSSAALSYPFEAPAFGAWVEVAPGVRWIRLPLPYDLDHINVWAIDDGEGWALVDTGVNSAASLGAWMPLLAEGPMSRPLTALAVTHMHPDHIGLAGWFSRRAGVPLHITRLEFLTCHTLVADTGREAPPDAIRYGVRAGWDAVALEGYRSRFGGFGRQIHALPDSYRRLRDGSELVWGGRSWRVITGGGHSPEHACLYCAEAKLLISGDQVLPRISSNVSVHPTEPEADPMSEWFDTLARLRELVPADVLVLPSHNRPFVGLHDRLDALERGQQTALTRLRRTLATGPKRVVDVFGALFARQVDSTSGSLLGLATGETLACMNYLIGRGEADQRVDEHGVAWYELATRGGRADH